MGNGVCMFFVSVQIIYTFGLRAVMYIRRCDGLLYGHKALKISVMRKLSVVPGWQSNEELCSYGMCSDSRNGRSDKKRKKMLLRETQAEKSRK